MATQRATQAQEVELSTEQEAVLKLVDEGRSVFFTGPAGTGKSFLLERIVKLLHRKRPASETAITATTGIAGLNIGGRTLHAYAGIGLGKESGDQLVEKIKKSIKLLKRWRRVHSWIIDEVSMLDGSLFDKLEYIARKVRNREEPFGGIQLIISGDFYQLPPVVDESYLQPQIRATFAFQAESWSRCVPRIVFLKKVFRQQDRSFIDLLNRIRCGNVNQNDILELKKLSRPLQLAHGLEPSLLFALRSDVDKYNLQRLGKLPGRQEVYQSMDTAGFDMRGFPVPIKDAKELLRRLVALPVLCLKVGAQVMLIKNVKDSGVDDYKVTKETLVNGSLGVVIGFLSEREARDREISIAQEDLGADERGNKAKAVSTRQYNPDEQALDGQIFGRHQRWPLVKFENGREYLCKPIDFTAEGFVGNVEARRLQVPLILAWAISVHKSQGQTLDHVRVDFAHIFAKGQAYVALSRARSLDGIQIDNFQASKINADPRVAAWYRQMAREADLDVEEEDKPQKPTVTSPKPKHGGRALRPGDDLSERLTARPWLIGLWSADENKHPSSTSITASMPPTKTPDEVINLSEKQNLVLQHVLAGHNVFFTGPAGSGKSTLLKEIIKSLRAKQGFGSEIAVTATTGIAGFNITGRTIHSFAGIKLGKEDRDVLLKRVRGNIKARMRWKWVKTLIIDEVSMLDGELFDKLEYIARELRDRDRPFGGIQLVLTGDFFQLPPVADKSHNHQGKAKFAFEATSWPACVETTVFLDAVFRQKDETFWEGSDEGLFPRREDVDNHNAERLRSLPDRQHTYLSVDCAGFDVNGFPMDLTSAAELIERTPAVLALALKVMLLRNVVDEGGGEMKKESLVNGSIGKVVAFYTEDEAKARRAKMERQKLDDPTMELPVYIEAKKPPQSGPGRDEQLLNGNCDTRPNKRWPLVLFANKREFLCQAVDFTVEGVRGNVEARRTQVPLILAWAMSIHKSQGQTIQYLKVDLARIFERGQSYVAISRATSPEGLQLLNFHESKVAVDPRVIAWHHQHSQVDDSDDEDDFPENLILASGNQKAK